MDYTHLGRTGLTVSRLCLGTMNFGPQTSEEDSHSIMDTALEQGIKVLVFMLADDEPWSRKFDELDKDPLIGAWRTELGERHICGPFGLRRGVGLGLPKSLTI